MPDDPSSQRIRDLRVVVDDYLDGLVQVRSPQTLYQPVVQVINSKGKRLRPLLTLLTAEAFGRSVDEALPAAAAVEIFHNFTLVHDDIMDQSVTRRGEPTVHTTWGEPAGILAGDFLLGLSYELLSRLPTDTIPPALRTFSEMVVQLCEGQALDSEFESLDTVTVSDYLDMVSRKTGALIVASLRLGVIVGRGTPEDVANISRVGYHMGLAFQIQDDLLDLTADEEVWGKPVGADLVTGKRAFLLLAAVEKEKELGSDWFRKVMDAGGINPSRIGEARDRMRDMGVLSDAREEIKKEYQKSIAALESVGHADELADIRWIIESMQSRIQ